MDFKHTGQFQIDQSSRNQFASNHIGSIRTSSHIVKSKAQIPTHPRVPRVLNPDPPKLFGIWWTLKLISVLVFSVKYKQRCENVVINFSIQPTTMYVGKYGLPTQSPTHQEMVEHHITYAYFLTVLHHDQTPIIRPHASPFQFVLSFKSIWNVI